MKRAFSMTELQAAIAAGSARSQEDGIVSTQQNTDLTTLRRSKSMNSITNSQSMCSPGAPSNVDLPQLEESCTRISPFESAHCLLPSLSSLGLSFAAGSQVHDHGFEELKRSRGIHHGIPISHASAQQDWSRTSSGTQDDETRGAAAALMDLFRQQPVEGSSCGVQQPQICGTVTVGTTLPSLQEMMANSNFTASSAPGWCGQLFNSSKNPMTKRDLMFPPVKLERNENGDFVEKGNASHQWQVSSRPPAESEDVKHNKYCHFCQHVKVKKASSMLACERTECSRRFCEHCLQAHLQDPPVETVRTACDGRWECPICRKTCCCSMPVCIRTHRHCKAYRYRQRRAEQAASRAPLDGRPNPPSPGKDPKVSPVCATPPPAAPTSPACTAAGTAAGVGGVGLTGRASVDKVPEVGD